MLIDTFMAWLISKGEILKWYWNDIEMILKWYWNDIPGRDSTW
jgi:hypothetical protein